MKRWIVFAFFALSFLLTIFISKEDTVIAEKYIEINATNSDVRVVKEGENVNTLFNNSFEQAFNFPL